MASYHPAVEPELRAILARGNRELKRCLGMMVERHLRIADGTEPLTVQELLPASGPALTRLFEVTYACGLVGRLVVVYEEVAGDVVVLAADAWHGLRRVGANASASDARARSWSRAT